MVPSSFAGAHERNRPLAQEAVGWEFLAAQFGITEEVPF